MKRKLLTVLIYAFLISYHHDGYIPIILMMSRTPILIQKNHFYNGSHFFAKTLIFFCVAPLLIIIPIVNLMQNLVLLSAR